MKWNNVSLVILHKLFNKFHLMRDVDQYKATILADCKAAISIYTISINNNFVFMALVWNKCNWSSRKSSVTIINLVIFHLSVGISVSHHNIQ